LAISKQDAESLLQKAGISPDLRAEALSLDQWVDLTRHFFAS
jgi:16S rRNA A1518/A1519 N6-dimethyltransferase RsmA/KsgA/DIM1 with predicted DNA glycosylase/AP lyase activity